MSEAQTSPGPYTWDDFVALEEDDPRELIDGELVEVEVPSKLHEYIVWMLSGYLAAWALPRKAGYGVVSGFKVRISHRRGVMPDLQFFRSTNPSAAGDAPGLVDGHPDLAVEIVSPSSRRYDRVTKLAWYASIGVPEYWILDPTAHTIERLVLQGDKYLVEQVASEADVFRPASFEELEIPLATLWKLPTTSA
ncbi:MAG TPA: Uma2 family endonuclease [Polyangiaceae bacterium]